MSPSTLPSLCSIYCEEQGAKKTSQKAKYRIFAFWIQTGTSSIICFPPTRRHSNPIGRVIIRNCITLNLRALIWHCCLRGRRFIRRFNRRGRQPSDGVAQLGPLRDHRHMATFDVRQHRLRFMNSVGGGFDGHIIVSSRHLNECTWRTIN
jgi:hypothetical protein